MEKIQLDIVGLSYSQTQSGAYALVLAERDGSRRLPIIIGAFEAQAIAIELESMVPSRPLTHDLFKSFATAFDIEIKEVIIYNLVEGIFYAKLICMKDGKELEIDTRTSDAVALAVRFKCPIFTFEFILSSAGIILEGGKEDLISEEKAVDEVSSSRPKKLSDFTSQELEDMLEQAIKAENYEYASRLRDELDKRGKK